MRVQKGFTLIELVVVMVILGILAAFAIPKFYDFSQQAKIAAVNGLAGAFNSANVTAHGAALAQGKTNATGDTISMEGTNNVSLAYGYPDTSATGIGAAVNISSDFQAGTLGGASVDYTYKGNTSCKVTFTKATSLTNPATVTTTTGGC